MHDKVFWITGASSGIGEGLFKYLNQQKTKTIISSRDGVKLQQLAAASAYPELVAVVPLDLGDYHSLESALGPALKAFGRVDVMVHNGGISQRSLVKETDFSVDEKIIRINFLGTVKLTKLLLPHFLERKSGDFIVISSLVGKFGTPWRSSYSASKHALHGFFDSLRAELSDAGVRVMMVCPGFIRTNVSVNALGAHGEANGKMDDAQSKGMEVSEFAKRLLTAYENNKLEVNIGGRETIGVLLKRLVPGHFAKMIAKAKVR